MQRERLVKWGAVIALFSVFITAASGAVVLNSSEYVGFNVSQGEVGVFNNTGLDLQGSDLYNYFQNDCPSGEVVREIGADGSFSCIDADDQNLSEVLVHGNVANTTISFSDGIAIGDSGTSVSASTGIAVGKSTSASAGDTVALGRDADATVEDAVAIGEYAAATAEDTVALGYSADASGDFGVAVGRNANASVGDSIVIGGDAKATGTSAVAIGEEARAPNAFEATFGNLNGEELDLNVTGNVTVHGADLEVLTGDVVVGEDLEFNRQWPVIMADPATEGSVQIYDGYNGQTVAEFFDGGKVNIPSGNLDMMGNQVQNVAELNVTNTSSGTRIADFEETGVTLHQPLNVESSGAMSVANGIDLTDSTSNTIDSYSTMYLQTSSGSPTDIVLDPTGVVGSRANLDMGDNNITNCDFIGGQSCDNLGDDQNLSEVLAAGNAAGAHNIDMDGNRITNIGSGGANFQSDGDLELPNSDLRMGGDYIWEVDDIVFNGGSNSYSAITLPDKSGGSLSITNQSGGAGQIMEWSKNFSTTVYGPLDMRDNTIRYSSGGITIGDSSTATSSGDAVSIGNGAEASSGQSTAVGHDAIASGFDAVAYGEFAEATMTDAAALGWDAKATNTSATALGASTNATGEWTTAVGDSAEAHGQESTAVGHLADAQASWATALGHGAVSAEHAAALGHDTEATAVDATAVGPHADASNTSDVAIGDSAAASGEKSVALGYGANASNYEAIAIGDTVTTSGYEAVAIGMDNTAASGEGSVAVGEDAIADADHAAAFGLGAQATGHGAFAIGEDVTASGAQAYAFGQNTVAADDYEAVFGAFGGDEMDINVTGNVTAHQGVKVNSDTFTPLSALFPGALVAQGDGAENAFMARTDPDVSNAAAGVFHQSSTSADYPAVTIQTRGDGTSNKILSVVSNADADGSTVTPRFNVRQNGNVNIPTGHLDMNGNNITNSAGGNVSIGDSLKVYGNVWASGADLAEMYRSPQELEAGEVVRISDRRDDAVERTNTSYQETVLGVVSGDPSHVMNMGETGYPIALEGKVPVNVSVENGGIGRGDRLVPSTTPGVAMTCRIIDPEESDRPLREVISHNQECRDSTFGRALEQATANTTILARIGG